MFQFIVSLILFLLPIPPWVDCNISFREGLLCDEEIQIYYGFLPLAFNQDPIPPVVRWEDGLLDWDYKDWCHDDQPECQEWPGIPFEYEAPPGYVISFVRLFSYVWGVGGAHAIYIDEGCFMKTCVDSLDGNIFEKTSTKIRIYIDEDRAGWGGPLNIIDICHEKEGYPYIMVCDNSYSTKYPTFQADLKRLDNKE